MLRWLPLCALVACSDGPSDGSDPTDPPATDPTGDTGRRSSSSPTGDTGAPVLPLDATWLPDADTPTFVTVLFTPRPGTATLTWSDLAGQHTTSVDAATGEVRLHGVPAGSEVTWSLVVDGADAAGFAEVPAPPTELTEWTVTEHSPAEAPGSWILTTQFHFNARSFAVLVDDAGRIRWWREAPEGHRIFRIHPTDDGGGLVWCSNTTNRNDDDGRIVREPLDGTEAITTTAPRLHHDFVEHGDGYAYLGWVDQDMALEPHGEVKPMSSDAIRLVDEGATGSYTDVFSFFDDWPAAVSQPCSHSSLGAFLPGRIEWTHSNSLVRDPGGDGWWVLARYLDAIGRVTADGTLTGIVGGDDATFVHTDGGLPFAHGHMSQVTDEGHLMVFSNGEHDHGPTEGSKAVELSIDKDAGTVTTEWTAPEPERRFVRFLGDVRRLPGGHTLIVNPNQGIYEVDASGAVVWEAHHRPEVDNGYNLGRVELVPPLPPYGG